MGYQGKIQNFSEEGAPIPRGCLPNILIIFSEKPHEIKEILVHRGAHVGYPAKSATGYPHPDLTWGGTPIPGQDQGYPPSRSGPRSGWGRDAPNWNSIVGSCCSAGSMPLGGFSCNMDFFVLNTNKMFKYDQIIKCISFRFSVHTAALISLCPESCQDVTPSLFVYLSF